MKKILLFLMLISSIFIADTSFAGRGCCSHHGGQAYCGSNGMWQCNDGTESPTCGCGYTPPTTNYNYYTPSYNYTPKVTIPTCLYGEQLMGGVCVSNEIACTKKYPGTTYDISSDKCICENGGEYDSKQKKCINKVQQCNAKYPGTTYQAEGDKCVCKNGGEYDSKQKSCITKPVITCKYSDGTKAKVGEVSAEGQICGTDGNWGCSTTAKWNSTLNKCVSIGDEVCTNAYGEFSVWNKTKSNGKYICTCKSGYEMIDNKCSQIISTNYITTTSNYTNNSNTSSSEKSIREQLCGANEYYSSSYSQCFCNSGYSKYNGVCTRNN